MFVPELLLLHCLIGVAFAALLAFIFWRDNRDVWSRVEPQKLTRTGRAES